MSCASARSGGEAPFMLGWVDGANLGAVQVVKECSGDAFSRQHHAANVNEAFDRHFLGEMGGC
jgi:hypothetical protein